MSMICFHASSHFPKVPCLCGRPHKKKSEEKQRKRKVHPPTHACWYLLCKLPVKVLVCNRRHRFLPVKKLRVDFFFFNVTHHVNMCRLLE